MLTISCKLPCRRDRARDGGTPSRTRSHNPVSLVHGTQSDRASLPLRNGCIKGLAGARPSAPVFQAKANSEAARGRRAWVSGTGLVVSPFAAVSRTM